jgi:hypothetical protein
LVRGVYRYLPEVLPKFLEHRDPYPPCFLKRV